MTEFITWLISEFKNNQFLVGIALPVVLGIAMYILRSIPQKIYYYLKLILTLEFTLTSRNDHYDEILKFLYGHRFKLFSRNYSISYNSAYLTPGYGVSVGMYNGVIFLFDREIFEQKIDLQEKTHITFLTRNLEFINKFFADCVSRNKDDIVGIYGQRQTYFDKICDRPKRSLKTVFINNHIKEDIIQKIDEFLKKEQWYIDRGISYKICFLLHGIPGTGKTSLIHALGSKYNYKLKMINDLHFIDKILADRSGYEEDVEEDIDGINAFYVIEDIDCLNLIKREDDDEKEWTPNASQGIRNKPVITKAPKQDVNATWNNLILQKILNTLDGISTPHGRIIFITTNKLESLDTALIRKGRIDHIINIDKLDSEQFIHMFTSFYGDTNKQLAVDLVNDKEYTPKVGADFSDMFLNNTPQQTIEKLKNE